MHLIKVFSVIFFTAICAADNPEDATSVFGNPSPTSPLPKSTGYEPPAPTLRLLSSWLNVFPTETVELNCSVPGSSDWTFTWHRNGHEVQDTDPNVSLSAGGSVLTVTAAAQMHSGNYSCKGKHKTRSATTPASNSLALSVYANKPRPMLTRSSNYDIMFTGESITFTCTVDVPSGWEYLWYHNGNEIPASNQNVYAMRNMAHPSSGQYHCKARRGQRPFYTEESGTTTLRVSDPPTPSLKLLSPWPDVFEEEIVELGCEVSGSDWTVTWYRNQNLLQEDDVLAMESEGSLLNITSASQMYQGLYSCKVHLESRTISSGFSNTVNVTVYEKVPKPTVSKNPGFKQMYVGETVNFTCNVNVSSGWEYHWYTDGNDLHNTDKTISIQLSSSNRGLYVCMATRRKTQTDISEEITQDILEIPVPALKLLTPWRDVFPTESVKLGCGMDGSSDWTYTWHRDGHEVQPDNVVSFDSNGATLTISAASAAHAGKYTCEGHLNGRSVRSSSSSGLTLTVYDKKPTVTLMRDPEYNVMFPGESVSFSCDINVASEWEYLWYKDNNPLGISGNKHLINSTATTNGGLYTCQVKRGTDQVFLTDSSQATLLKVEENTPKPSMARLPDVDKVYTGESVSFECKVELSSGWKYFWYKDGALLHPKSSSSFNIHNATLLDSGTYSCMAVRDKTMYSTKHSDGRLLHISEIPVPALKLLTPWRDVFPTESVKLGCGMGGSSEWTYTWHRDGHEVQAGGVVSFDSDKTTLTISAASASHRGEYSCSGTFKSRPVSSSFSSGQTLDVYERKPRVILTQNPIHNVMHTGDSASFSCHINVSSGWEYLWYKDGSALHVSGNNHTIAPVKTAETGSYTCQAKRGSNTVLLSDLSQAVRLDIKERPKAEITLLTGWSEVFSTDSLVLRCAVQGSQDTWNYTWFKEGKGIEQLPSERHTVTPRNDPEQGKYTCQGIRSGRPSYSQSSHSFPTKNLLLRRRVLLSISGCIFFGLIAVFLGFIPRLFHKKVDDDNKPEEENLFLTMAQLKDCHDAPCPLVEYITDAALNAPSKEEEETAVICSETTPLPISPQEDQAVTTENHDTTESNGGLVSFKQ